MEPLNCFPYTSVNTTICMQWFSAHGYKGNGSLVEHETTLTFNCLAKVGQVKKSFKQLCPISGCHTGYCETVVTFLCQYGFRICVRILLRKSLGHYYNYGSLRNNRQWLVVTFINLSFQMQGFHIFRGIKNGSQWQQMSAYRVNGDPS